MKCHDMSLTTSLVAFRLEPECLIVQEERGHEMKLPRVRIVIKLSGYQLGFKIVLCLLLVILPFILSISMPKTTLAKAIRKSLDKPDIGKSSVRFETVARHGFDLLEPSRFAVLVIDDKYSRGELIPLGFYCMDRMRQAGFRPKAIVVKNITGNERGKGRASNLWRYRALAGGYYLFRHEYVMIFRKRPQSRRARRD